MTSLSLLFRLAIVVALLSIAFVPASSSSSSSSSTASAPVSSSSSSTSDPATLSSSSGAPITPPQPVIEHVYGCDPTNALSTTTCDGSDNSTAILTILGRYFGAQSALHLTGASQTIYTPSAILTANDTAVTAATFALQPKDIGEPALLTLTNLVSYQTSAPYPLTFTIAGKDDGGDSDVRVLGLALRTFVIVVAVVGLLVLAVLSLCVLSVCCGVTMGCLQICCPRRPSGGAVLGSASAGYHSGYSSMS